MSARKGRDFTSSELEEIARYDQGEIGDGEDHRPASSRQRRKQANQECSKRFRHPPDGAEMGLRERHQRIGFPIAGQGKRRIRRDNIGKLESAEQHEQHQPIGAPVHHSAPCCSYGLRRGERNSGPDVFTAAKGRVSHPTLRFGTSIRRCSPARSQETVKRCLGSTEEQQRSLFKYSLNFLEKRAKQWIYQ